MVWGKMFTKDGKAYNVDDYKVEGEVVKIIASHSHREILIPLENLSSLEEGNPNGWEKRFKSKADQ